MKKILLGLLLMVGFTSNAQIGTKTDDLFRYIAKSEYITISDIQYVDNSTRVTGKYKHNELNYDVTYWIKKGEVVTVDYHLKLRPWMPLYDHTRSWEDWLKSEGWELYHGFYDYTGDTFRFQVYRKVDGSAAVKIQKTFDGSYVMWINIYKVW